MKKIKFRLLFLLSIFLVVSSCETTDLDLRVDPNGATPSDANVQLLLNGAINSFRHFNERLTNFGMEVTRMKHGSGPVYGNAYTPEDFNTLWQTAYAGLLENGVTVTGVLANTQSVIKNGNSGSLFEHVAVAKIIQSYTLTSLVDMFGDVPYTEAIQFSNNLNPNVDDDQSIYQAALTLLDEAITDFGKSSLGSLTSDDDIFYQGDTSKWIKLAKTLKLRIYNNVRLSPMYDGTAVQSLITENDLITSSADDFQIEYGTKDNDPDVRHFKFRNAYLGDGGEYMATYFMNIMYHGKSVVDPRMNYYFYRQSTSYPDPSTAEGLFTMPCLGETKPNHYAFNDPFCNIGDGYWGRDHFDNAGGPPDGNRITVWGLYPAGGKYDTGAGGSVGATDGAKGEGIMPIWTAANTNFVLAELALTEGTSGDPSTYLRDGMNASLEKVTTFRTDAIPDGASVPSQSDKDAYMDEVINNYNAASPDEKLNIIITEAYISNWCNGIEVYNNYRRTGMPNNMQPTKSATPGAFISSFPYPANLVNLNSNVSAKAGNTVKVFWDLNPNVLN